MNFGARGRGQGKNGKGQGKRGKGKGKRGKEKGKNKMGKGKGEREDGFWGVRGEGKRMGRDGKGLWWNWDLE